MPGIGKWIVAAVLAGLASALGGLVARGADKAITRGREAVLPPSPLPPITVKARQYGGLGGDIRNRSEMSVRDWVDFGDPRVYLNATTVDLVVEATVDRAVILSQLEVRVESRGAPPRIFDHGYLAGGAMEIRSFHVDLADPTPEVRPADGSSDFPFTVSHLDPERFIIEVTSSTPGDFTWRFDVHWLCKGQSGVVTANQQGPPFRLIVDPRLY
ncbi:hypothetical protein [Streptomyces sp. NRRL S-378]|uniref:hypothetical protein n=1 Tax=Streptomyces sp. NRRL S-378 TaxID=1463904 RepID=UPI0004C8D8ED|nr:hypothetical protein [Streptomyces sp. NRRL S-378]